MGIIDIVLRSGKLTLGVSLGNKIPEEDPHPFVLHHKLRLFQLPEERFPWMACPTDSYAYVYFVIQGKKYCQLGGGVGNGGGGGAKAAVEVATTENMEVDPTDESSVCNGGGGSGGRREGTIEISRTENSKELTSSRFDDDLVEAEGHNKGEDDGGRDHVDGMEKKKKKKYHRQFTREIMGVSLGNKIPEEDPHPFVLHHKLRLLQLPEERFPGIKGKKSCQLGGGIGNGRGGGAKAAVEVAMTENMEVDQADQSSVCSGGGGSGGRREGTIEISKTGNSKELRLSRSDDDFVEADGHNKGGDDGGRDHVVGMEQKKKKYHRQFIREISKWVLLLY
ncbi:OLC1v1004868C1 [Oldenlandia corymbosa var. corymbosa]|uniref:OLC1v1004868C1 n=1 Tax=Oldenlandia corymbosa var. corymbosa TaxID=529605 RepID=A0AAV1DDD0_OLDCO|nr:OLC1v1004868C1 [Oldenlandia corymbosa var. corymbosa]